MSKSSIFLIDNGFDSYSNVKTDGKLTFVTDCDTVIYEDGYTKLDLFTEKKITVIKGASWIGKNVIAVNNSAQILYIEKSAYIGGKVCGFSKVKYFGDESGLFDIKNLKINITQ